MACTKHVIFSCKPRFKTCHSLHLLFCPELSPRSACSQNDSARDPSPLFLTLASPTFHAQSPPPPSSLVAPNHPLRRSYLGSTVKNINSSRAVLEAPCDRKGRKGGSVCLWHSGVV